MNRKILENIAKEIEIDIISVTDANPLSEYKEYLEKRIESNANVEFEETNVEKRIDPKLLLESVKSIIVVGISYNTGYKTEINNNDTLYGKLSSISYGEDYHNIVNEKLDLLATKIEESGVIFEWRKFVDTGPLLDKAIALKAGIGWQGKNTLIINEKYGSKISIGYLLTDIEMTEFEVSNSNAQKVDCGECNICINACPTKALKGDYTMDSKKCVSYLTQTKEEIPYELRSKMGLQVYGCDICQLVCPHNKSVYLTEDKSYLPEKTLGLVDIEELFNMSKSEFQEKYGNMTGAWRGKNVLLRNSAIALANMKNEKAYDLLLKNIDNNSKIVREYVYWALLSYKEKHPEVEDIINERTIQMQF